MKKINTLVICVLVGLAVSSQSTYHQVYTILQGNCTNNCHTVSNPYNLILTDSANLYNMLVGQSPQNAAAVAAGLKLVDPGNPGNSLLFTKVNHGLDPNLTLPANQGMAMPDSNVSMTKTQREMIRQWILFGARDTGTFVDMGFIDSFYYHPVDTAEHLITPLAPPAPGQGYQLHFGPIFMYSGQEFEYNNKYYLNNNQTIDISRMKVYENPETHHFAIYDFFPHLDTLLSKGLNKVIGISDEALLYYNANVVAQWPKPMDVTYPSGTALVWADSTIICLDYHLINFETYPIAAEAYLNVYYNPHSTSINAIQTYPVRYGGDNVFSLVIPNNGKDTTFTIVQGGQGGGPGGQPSYVDSTFYWNIVSMQGHTHKHGVGFNVWSRKANGDKDSLIYNGNYDPTYTYNQGTFTWNDAPYRRCDPIFPVWMPNGLIHEATFLNTGPDTVGFGLTSQDEMFVTFILYYESEFPATEVGEVYKKDNIKMFPNPAFDLEYIRIDNSVSLQKPEMIFYDALGRKVIDIKDISSHLITTNMANLADGCYVYQLINGGEVAGTGKIFVQH